MVEKVDPESEVFNILKVHDSKTVHDISLCIGSVEYNGEYFYALYIIESSGEVWFWDLRENNNHSNRFSGPKVDARVITTLLKNGYRPNLESREAVPVEVAVEGKPAVAAYLYGIYQYDRSEIAKIMDVDQSTVGKYLRRFADIEIELELDGL